MKKLEREALLADREAARSILASIEVDDPIGRLSFEARLHEINEQLVALGARHETHGSVALLFNGTPVHGSRAIDAGFAARALSSFQDILTKHLASEERGALGARGRIPLRTPAALAIHDLVRGSVGFVLEESGNNAELIDSSVKQAIDDVTKLIAKTASEDDADFEEAVEVLDHRELLSLREFFKTLDDGQATLRIVEEDQDAILDTPAVQRARRRVERTEIKDRDSDRVEGELLGLLPDARRFEMKLTGGELIRGKVATTLAERYLTLIESPKQDIVGRFWRTKMHIREVRERNKPLRKLYLLIGLLEPIKKPKRPKAKKHKAPKR